MRKVIIVLAIMSTLAIAAPAMASVDTVADNVEQCEAMGYAGTFRGMAHCYADLGHVVDCPAVEDGLDPATYDPYGRCDQGLGAAFTTVDPDSMPDVPVFPIMEDDPRWDCATMGNRVCGPDQPEQAPDLTQSRTVPMVTTTPRVHTFGPYAV